MLTWCSCLMVPEHYTGSCRTYLQRTLLEVTYEAEISRHHMKSLGREGLKCKALLQELQNKCMYVLKKLSSV